VKTILKTTLDRWSNERRTWRHCLSHLHACCLNFTHTQLRYNAGQWTCGRVVI